MGQHTGARPRTLRWLELALWCSGASGLGGCSEDAHPPLLADSRARAIEGCETFSYETCDIRDSDCQSELFGLVACLRGESVAADASPPVSLLSEAEAAELMRGDAEAEADPALVDDFSANVRGLELLGLLDPGLISAPSDVVDVRIQSVAAFYQPSTRAVVIIDRGDPLADLDANATLAHEFVHALQDRRHDLGSFLGDVQDSSDRALALSAVVEGEAMLYQLLLLLSYSGVDVKQANYAGLFQSLVTQGEQLASNSGSPMVTAAGIFPYTHGARFMGEHWLQGGHEALDQLYEQPPASSLQVMWEGSGALPAITAFEVPPAPLDGYRFVGDDVAGAWVMFSRLLELASAVDSASTLRTLASHWRGDHLWVYQSEALAAGTTVLWWIDWADAVSATQFAELFGRFHPDPAAIQVAALGKRSRVVVSDDAGALDGWALRLAEGSP